MLHQDIKSLDLLEPKNQAKLYLSWEQSIKSEVCSNIPRPSSVIMDQSLKTKWQSCLRNTMLRFEEQQRNISTPIWPLWKPLTKSWQNCCLNLWMLKNFKVLRKYQQVGSKIWTRPWTKWKIQYCRWLVWSLKMQLN